MVTSEEKNVVIAEWMLACAYYAKLTFIPFFTKMLCCIR